MGDARQLEREVEAEYRQLVCGPKYLGEYSLILGPTASGKTSTIKRFLTENPTWQSAYDDALLTSDRFRYYNKKIFEEGDSNYYLAFETEALLRRHMQNAHGTRVLVCDQGVHSIWAYCLALYKLGKIEGRIYQTFYSLFLLFRSKMTWPRVVVRFECTIQVALERMRSRGRSHESIAITSEFLTELNCSYTRVLEDFQLPIITCSLDTTELTIAQAATTLAVAIHASPHR